MKYFPLAACAAAFLTALVATGCDSAEKTTPPSAVAPTGGSASLPPGIPPQARAQIEKKMQEKMKSPGPGGKQ